MRGDGLSIILALLPLIAAAVLAFAKPPAGVAWVNAASAWWEMRYQRAKAGSGWIAGLWRALIWGFHKLHELTGGIVDDAVRAAVRAALFLYVGALSLLVIGTALYTVAVFAMIALGLWIAAKALKFNAGLNDGVERRSEGRDFWGATRTEVRDGHGELLRTEQVQTDWWGKSHVEHRDAQGNFAGETRRRDGLFGGGALERRDAEGRVVATEREREGLFGDRWTETRDAEDRVTATAAHRESLVEGDYVEHRDAEGRVTARTFRRTSLFGDRIAERRER